MLAIETMESNSVDGVQNHLKFWKIYGGSEPYIQKFFKI